MIDREKVIKGLECHVGLQCNGCPYVDSIHPAYGCHLEELIADARALLKEQEPVKAVADGEDSYRCDNCGTVVGWAEWEPGGVEEVKYKFCPECGRPVKWNE